MPIDAIQNPFGNFSQQGPAPAAAGESGSFMGCTVQVAPTPEELLADAAEELSFSADKTEDFELEERKEKNKAALDRDDRVRLYQELMHQAGKSEQMGKLRDSLRAREDSRRAIDKAREYFSDPSDAWAALLEIGDEFRKGGDHALARAVEEAAAELEEREGPAIRAGIQGALAARGFEDVDGADALRDLYRQTACSFTTVGEVFEDIQRSYGGDFDRAMDFLFSALSADIASDAPSMGREHLEGVHESLGKVRLTQSAFKLCERMIGRWEDVHGVKPAQDGLTAMDLLREIITLKDTRFLGAMHVEPLAQKAKAPDIEHEVLFLQELLNTARNFPPAFFDDDQGRMKVLDAVQEAVDQAIAREDEYLAGQEG